MTAGTFPHRYNDETQRYTIKYGGGLQTKSIALKRANLGKGDSDDGGGRWGDNGGDDQWEDRSAAIAAAAAAEDSLDPFASAPAPAAAAAAKAPGSGLNDMFSMGFSM
jgi:hypothetical protein